MIRNWKWKWNWAFFPIRARRKILKRVWPKRSNGRPFRFRIRGDGCPSAGCRTRSRASGLRFDGACSAGCHCRVVTSARRSLAFVLTDGRGQRRRWRGGARPAPRRPWHEGLALQMDQLPQGLPAAVVRALERGALVLQVYIVKETVPLQGRSPRRVALVSHLFSVPPLSSPVAMMS